MTRDAPSLTLVTGAAGWLGTALVEALSGVDGARARVRALVRDPDEAEGDARRLRSRM